jgi:ubiquinone/menaquinone biosynthesis C-methylase UbiE
VASAEYLPFCDGVFDLVYSSHTIEHVADPFKMFRELVRVSSRKVVVKCPDRLGSGGRRPFHLNYFNEEWFKVAAFRVGVLCETFVNVVDDAPFTQRVYQKLPRMLRFLYGRNIVHRVARKVERKIAYKLSIPFEVEAHITKKVLAAESANVVFIVVYNDVKTFQDCFLSGIGVRSGNIVSFNNQIGLGLGFAYNDLALPYLNRDAWLVFCHQDFIFKESLAPKLASLNRLGVYGPIGCRLGTLGLVGEVTQTDGSKVGAYISKPTPVEALDEMCLIVHTEALRRGLWFDDKFTFHYYGADLCTQARRLGFDVKALQLDCQHRSKTLTGDIFSESYRNLQSMFRAKWCGLLPLATTTGVIKK